MNHTCMQPARHIQGHTFFNGVRPGEGLTPKHANWEAHFRWFPTVPVYFNFWGHLSMLTLSPAR